MEKYMKKLLIIPIICICFVTHANDTIPILNTVFYGINTVINGFRPAPVIVTPAQPVIVVADQIPIPPSPVVVVRPTSVVVVQPPPPWRRASVHRKPAQPPARPPHRAKPPRR